MPPARRRTTAASPAVTKPKMTGLDDFDDPIGMVVYADSGEGKTVLGGTCPRGVILAIEKGVKSARYSGSKNSAVDAVNGSAKRRMGEVNKLISWGERDAADFKASHDWLVIDSGTALQELIGMSILGEEGKRFDPDVMAMQDYQVWQARTKKYIRRINALPINVLWLARAMHDEDEDGDPLLLPDLTGKNGTNDKTTMSRWFMAELDVVSHLRREEDENGNVVRVLTNVQKKPYYGKDRYDALGDEITNPSMADITALIESKKSGTTTAAPARRRTRRPV